MKRYCVPSVTRRHTNSADIGRSLDWYQGGIAGNTTSPTTCRVWNSKRTANAIVPQNFVCPLREYSIDRMVDFATKTVWCRCWYYHHLKLLGTEAFLVYISINWRPMFPGVKKTCGMGRGGGHKTGKRRVSTGYRVYIITMCLFFFLFLSKRTTS